MKNRTFSKVPPCLKLTGVPVLVLLSLNTFAKETKAPKKPSTATHSTFKDRVSTDRKHRLPIKITGKVISEDGSPVAGANILVKGTINGYSTNKEGRFEFGIPAEGQVLVVTAMGFEKKEVLVGKET